MLSTIEVSAKLVGELNLKLIEAEGTRLLRDQLAKGRPRRSKAKRRLPAARGKRVPEAEINQQEDQNATNVHVMFQYNLNPKLIESKAARKAWPKGETPQEQGEEEVHGRPRKASV